MALTVTNRHEGVAVNGDRYVEATVAFDSSYQTGGLALAAQAILGLREVHEVHAVLGVSGGPDAQRRFNRTGHTAPGTANNGRGIRVDFTDPKVPKLLLNTAASTEAANASDQSAYQFRLRFIGA